MFDVPTITISTTALLGMKGALMEKAIERTSPIILVTSDEFKKAYLDFCKSLGESPSDIFTSFMKEAMDSIGKMKIDFSNLR
jgi:hypothetical protein